MLLCINVQEVSMCSNYFNKDIYTRFRNNMQILESGEKDKNLHEINSIAVVRKVKY